MNTSLQMTLQNETAVLDQDNAVSNDDNAITLTDLAYVGGGEGLVSL
jgi:hypothetical protein